MKQEIKIDGKVICVKESGGGGKIVYKHAGNMPRPIEVYAEDIETYVDCAIENFKALEDLILSSDCDQGTISWAFLLRAIRRDAEHRIGRLFAVLWETIGPLHGIHEKSQLADFPLIDVVHKEDLDKIKEAAG